MTPGSQHPLRCETCGYRYHRDIGKCPFDFEDAYYLLKDEMQLPRGAWLLTSVVGCASHTSARSEREIRAPDCIRCHKHADGYILGKSESRITQCSTCIFNERRECMYHGYPEDAIPHSCEYKIGKCTVIDPIESQMHNKLHDGKIRADEREKLGEFIDSNMIESGDCVYSDEPVIQVSDLVRWMKLRRQQSGGGP